MFPNKEIETEDEDELSGFLLYKEGLIFPKSEECWFLVHYIWLFAIPRFFLFPITVLELELHDSVSEWYGELATLDWREGDSSKMGWQFDIVLLRRKWVIDWVSELREFIGWLFSWSSDVLFWRRDELNPKSSISKKEN